MDPETVNTVIEWVSVIRNITYLNVLYTTLVLVVAIHALIVAGRKGKDDG